MNDSVTIEDINRQLVQLDREFASPENCKTGKLNFDQFHKRRGELLRRLKSAERAPPAPTAAPSLTASQLDAILRPPLPAYGKFESAARAELARLMKTFDAALDSGNVEAARDILADSRRRELATEKSLAIILKNFSEAYVSAKTFAPLLVGAIAFLHDELTEAKLLIRMHSARADSLERKLERQTEDARRLIETESAKWALDFERRIADLVQRAVDQIPRPKDGMSVDDFDLTLEGRTLSVSIACGERIVEKQIKVPFPIYRGIYRHKANYESGDLITWGGSVWLSRKDNPTTRPPSDEWQLVVQRGKDAPR